MKVALVTGSSRRIGKAIIQALHQAGFAVIIHGYQSHVEAYQLMETLNAIKPNTATVILKNLAETDSAAVLVQQALTFHNRLDLLINNASLFLRDKQLTDSKALEALFKVNVYAPFYLSHAAYLSLANYQGNIINITDIHASKPLKGYSLYCQTKAALSLQTLCLAKEFAPKIRVNAVAPGAIIWPENQNGLNRNLQQKIIQSTLLKKHGHPQWIADAILSLINNPFITGQTLTVDGGRNI